MCDNFDVSSSMTCCDQEVFSEKKLQACVTRLGVFCMFGCCLFSRTTAKVCCFLEVA